jgi:hypothetical protein
VTGSPEPAAQKSKDLTMTRKIGKPDWFQTIGLTVFVVLAIVLPFELKDPLFHVGPLGITSVEIVIYLAVGVWAAQWLVTRRRLWTLAHTAIAAWAVILILSACLAPSYRAEALKFAFRVAGSCTLCIAAASFVRTPRSAALVGSGLLAGSVLSAAAAQAEILLPGAASFLANFKADPSMTGQYLRASGTFQYANIASMYWEAALPLAPAVFLWWGRRRFAGRCWWAALACLLLLCDAILISASRAGILVALVSLAALYVISRHLLPSLRSLAGFGLISSVALIAIHLASNNLLMLRLTFPNMSAWYHAEYEDFPVDLTMEAGGSARIPLTIRNRGNLAWSAQGSQSVVVSYHWLDPNGEKILLWEGSRTALPADVEPGAALKMEPLVIAGSKPGRYILQWDMLQEKIAWFSVYRIPKSRMHVLVLPSTAGTAISKYPPPMDWPLLSVPRRDLWRAAVRMWLQSPVLGAGPDNFRRLFGPYLGLKRFDTRIYSNNLYLELLSTAGLAGLAGLIAVLITTTAAAKRAWLGAEHPEDKLLVVGIGLGLAAFYLHGLVDYFFAFTPTYGMFWILTGMAVGLAHGGNSQ